jgi:hypothetical protein
MTISLSNGKLVEEVVTEKVLGKLPYYYDMKVDIKRRAREALRTWVKSSDFSTSDISADVIIEQIWNSLAGRT